VYEMLSVENFGGTWSTAEWVLKYKYKAIDKQAFVYVFYF